MKQISPILFKKTTLLVVFFMLMPRCYAVITDSKFAYPQQSLPNISNQWQPVADSQLAALRGGFVLTNGVIIDINFEKQIFRNGIKTFMSSFQSPKNLDLIKNGEFNVATALSNAMHYSITQNDLDNQIIKTFNTINIDIKNLNNTNLSLSSSEFYTKFVLPYNNK